MARPRLLALSLLVVACIAASAATAAPVLPQAAAFQPLADYVNRPIGGSMLFIPLGGDGYKSCLPMPPVCEDAGHSVYLVPAEGVNIAWRQASPALAEARRNRPVPAIGTADPAASLFLVPLIDAGQASGEIRVMPRSASGGLLTPTRVTSESLVGALPQVEPQPATDFRPAPLRSPFGTPTEISPDVVAQGTPVLAVTKTGHHVIFGILPSPAWQLSDDVVELVGHGGVARLLFRPNGTVGLVVPGRFAPDFGVPTEVERGPSLMEWGLGGAGLLALAGLSGYVGRRRRMIE